MHAEDEDPFLDPEELGDGKDEEFVDAVEEASGATVSEADHLGTAMFQMQEVLASVIPTALISVGHLGIYTCSYAKSKEPYSSLLRSPEFSFRFCIAASRARVQLTTWTDFFARNGGSLAGNSR